MTKHKNKALVITGVQSSIEPELGESRAGLIIHNAQSRWKVKDHE